MKNNELKELHLKTEKELQKMLEDRQKELVTNRLDHARGKLKNTSYLSILRKAISQIQSVLHGKELAHGKNA